MMPTSAGAIGEQADGSPDGKPTSAPVYAGKLIETVPPAASAPAPAK